jgi:DNA helicase-2/ATP-dependent DNA helicase PcrA
VARLNLSAVETLAPPPSLTWTPSPQQEAIFEYAQRGQGSAIIVAVAGAGKTTTLVRMCQLLTGGVAFAAYNKKIADEIAFKLNTLGIGRQVSARTFHSFGFSAWRKLAPDVKVEARKMDDICDQMQIKDEDAGIVKKLVSIAKNHAIGVEVAFDNEAYWHHLIEHYDLVGEGFDPNDDKFKNMLMRYANAALKASMSIDHEYIDFDDMLFAPLIHGAAFWKNDWVLVDEAQDTNPARRMIAERMLKPGGRLIAVGDPRQAIYGFTGADADALEIIQARFNCIELPLTVTYRCPKSVVRFAQRWVSHIEAAPSAPEGQVRTVSLQEFRKEFPQMNHRTAILCRLTKPLVKTAFELIKAKVPCHVEGREIGQQLITLVKRAKTTDARDALDELKKWVDIQVLNLIAKKKDYEAGALQDKIDTIEVIVNELESNATVWQLRSEIMKLFGDTEAGVPSDTLTLSTVHKSKGREWPVVYLYGRTSYMPSMFAKQEWQLTQENNLIYVAVTRAQASLIEVDLNLI